MNFVSTQRISKVWTSCVRKFLGGGATWTLETVQASKESVICSSFLIVLAKTRQVVEILIHFYSNKFFKFYLKLLLNFYGLFNRQI